MAKPDDFGLSPTQTLAHVGDPTPAPGHGPFWNRWSGEVWRLAPTLEPLKPGDADGKATQAAGVTHTFTSLGGVRVGCRLVEPKSGTVKGGVVTSHGYTEMGGIDDASPWAGRDLIVLKLRIRGFQGSQMDSGDLVNAKGGWIVQGLGEGDAWTLPGAVADVANACRALSALCGPDTPISIHGESFGGGLAVLAAAQLAGRLRLFRMALGVPTFGDWPWRFAQAGSSKGAGSGDEVMRFMANHPDSADQVALALRLLDPVVHAPRIYCPVVCKLAMRDDVVPAPSAAAVYNALGTSPGRKWRYVTEYGHYDGGIADGRRHARFEQLTGAFLDPSVDIVRLMHEWTPELYAQG